MESPEIAHWAACLRYSRRLSGGRSRVFMLSSMAIVSFVASTLSCLAATRIRRNIFWCAWSQQPATSCGFQKRD